MERMSAELDALGGGDARIGHLDVCVMATPLKDSAGGTISHRNGKVLVSDPGCPGGEAGSSVRRYAIAKFIDGEGAGQDEVFQKLGKVFHNVNKNTRLHRQKRVRLPVRFFFPSQNRMVVYHSINTCAYFSWLSPWGATVESPCNSWVLSPNVSCILPHETYILRLIPSI